MAGEQIRIPVTESAHADALARSYSGRDRLGAGE
jgi:hypothetical protein